MRNISQLLLGIIPLSMCLVLMSGEPARAQVFTLDTNLSSITITGLVAGFTISPQGPGSLTTKYGGTFQVALSGNSIQFSQGSLIQALDSGSWQPNPDGSSGSAPANYGGYANAGFAVAQAALRDIQLDVISPVMDFTNAQFASQNLTFFFPSNAPSSAAYNINGFFFSRSGFIPLSGYGTNRVTTISTLTVAGNQEVLTIPVDALFHFSLLNPDDTPVAIQGTFVAVRSLGNSIVISSPVVSNGTLRLQWQAPPNQLFQIQSSTDFTTWQTIASNVTSTTTAYVWDGTAALNAGFFRLSN